MSRRIYFTKVIALPNGEAMVLGHMASEEHDPTFTRLMLVTPSGWKLVGDLRDVAYAAARGPATGDVRPDVAIVGRSGLFRIYSAGKPVVEGLVARKDTTYLQAVDYRDRTPYVCGGQNQVFRLEGSAWHDEASAIYEPFAGKLTASLNDLAADVDGDVLCVGDQGEIALLVDGRWRRIESSTNVDLLCVIAAGDAFYAGGPKGTLLQIAGGLVTHIEDPLLDDARINDLVLFRHECWIAASDRLLRMTKDGLVAVETPNNPDTNSIVSIDTCGESLWMTGGEELYRFDGRDWTTLQCPDNAS